jgi:SAM-dependent methyltransferase
MSNPLSDEESVWLPVPEYPPNAFVGTARYYTQHRPPYLKNLRDDLCTRARITTSGRLLDLGCGPGRAAIALAPSFSEVWAIDLEPEMIEVGREEAKRQGVANIRWLTERAEDLEAPSESFELITIGEAFHRLDQRLITQRAMTWLSPSGCLATMGGYDVFKGEAMWQKLGAEVKARWASKRNLDRARSPDQPDLPRGPLHTPAVLQAAGFVDIENYEFKHPFIWTLDAIIGNIYSGSAWSQRVLDNQAEPFEADLRRTLLKYNPQGQYPTTLSFGYTSARRPKYAGRLLFVFAIRHQISHSSVDVVPPRRWETHPGHR